MGEKRSLKASAHRKGLVDCRKNSILRARMECKRSDRIFVSSLVVSIRMITKKASLARTCLDCFCFSGRISRYRHNVMFWSETTYVRDVIRRFVDVKTQTWSWLKKQSHNHKVCTPLLWLTLHPWIRKITRAHVTSVHSRARARRKHVLNKISGTCD